MKGRMILLSHFYAWVVNIYLDSNVKWWKPPLEVKNFYKIMHLHLTVMVQRMSGRILGRQGFAHDQMCLSEKSLYTPGVNKNKGIIILFFLILTRR